MRFRTIAVVAVLLPFAAGCLAPAGPEATGTDDEGLGPAPAEVQRIEWRGHVVHGALDPLAHMRDPETALFPVHQAGFLVEVDETPSAIEVTVSWDTSGATFMLHPHYKARDDTALGGETLYYGYPSERFGQSPGCIRIPVEDMAAGVWPMMVHPDRNTVGVDFTITVAIAGATGRVLDEMHGHRTDGPAPVEDRAVEECRLPAPTE